MRENNVLFVSYRPQQKTTLKNLVAMRRFRVVNDEEYDDSWGGDQIARVSHGSGGSPPRLSCVVPIPGAAAATARRKILESFVAYSGEYPERPRPSKSARIEPSPSQRASTGSNQHLVISRDSPSQKSPDATSQPLDQQQHALSAQSSQGDVTLLSLPLKIEVVVNGQNWIVNNVDELIPQFLYALPSGGCSELSQGDCLKVRTFLGRCFRKFPIPETSSDDESQLSEIDSETDEEDEGVIDSSDTTASCSSDDSDSSCDSPKRKVRVRRPKAVEEEGHAPTQQKKSSALTVPQLKEQLKVRGLPVSGRKSALLTRLKAYEDKETVIKEPLEAVTGADEPCSAEDDAQPTANTCCVGFVPRSLLLASILEAKTHNITH